MSTRNIGIVVAVVVVIAIIGYALGWFGGAPAPTATPDAAAPAAPATN